MSDGRGYDLEECLGAVDPAGVTYQEWVEVGMALKAEGYPFAAWDAWSRRDAARYRGDGGMERKWAGFSDGKGAGVGGGTVVELARSHGWEPTGHGRGEALSWDGWVDADGGGRVVDPTWVEAADMQEPGAEWDPAGDLVRYIGALFGDSETIGYVVNAVERGGRWVPADRGAFMETAGDVAARVAKYGADFASSLGWNSPEAGGWIRFNPLDGEGVRNDNVADFRYALVESDSMPVARQMALIEELQLPVAALVHSGGKSLHAVVRIGAADYAEYRRRVDFLYETCARNGLSVDTQNKNPSRLTRMPGLTRGGRKQWLVGTDLGKGSWSEWREWIEGATDDLPEPEPLDAALADMPELSPPLIDGVLRQGHKMLLAGPSKAGKSFALIGLCVAIAEGLEWMGFRCAQGRVLYVNLELDRASCLHRFRDVYRAAGIEPERAGSIDVWNLRGKSKPMDQLAPALIRRAMRTRPIAVVIDPIYKVITGDENSADQMAAFCNQFDRVADALGCAVVYCHHHSKGAQGSKRSMDRASGSGVFARDPDAMLDMIELHVSDELREQQSGAAACGAVAAFLDRRGPAGWRDSVGYDDMQSDRSMLAAAKGMLGDDRAAESDMLAEVAAARARAAGRTAWRVEGTLREFRAFDPVLAWFDYPMHRPDRTGALDDAEAEGDHLASAWGGKPGRDRRKSTPEERSKSRKDAVEEAYGALDMGDGVTVEEMAEFMGVSEKTVRRRIAEHGGFWAKGGAVGRRRRGASEGR